LIGIESRGFIFASAIAYKMSKPLILIRKKNKLPSEKQWEKAARGETGDEYPWGKKFHPDYANLSTKPGSRNPITQVGSYPRGATPLGVHDLVGNVWEWVEDDYSPYKGVLIKVNTLVASLKFCGGNLLKI